MLHKQTASLSQRLVAWQQSQPAWLRPALFGTLALPRLVASARYGYLSAVAIFLVVALFGEQPSLLSVFLALAVLASLCLAGGLMGLAYSVVGLRVAKVPAIGSPAAGIVCLAPAWVAFVLTLRLRLGEPVWAVPSPVDLAIHGSVLAACGASAGYVLFRRRPPVNAADDAAS